MQPLVIHPRKSSSDVDAETLAGLLLAVLRDGVALQAEHYGDGMSTHLALIDWADKARAAIATAEGRA